MGAISSGVILLEGTHGQGMVGLGALSIKKGLRKVQKIKGHNACEPCSVGSRGPLKGPGGVQGKAPEAVVFFNAETAFSAQTYVHEIVVKLTNFPKFDPCFRIFLGWGQDGTHVYTFSV